MMNFTFIGIRTNAYEFLVDNVKEVTQRHEIQSNIIHINEVDEIMNAKVESIPAIHITPGDIVLHNPSVHQIESSILRLKPKNNKL